MASSSFSPPNAFKLHSFPQIFKKLHFFAPFSLLLNPHATDMADKIPHRDSAPFLSSLRSAAELVVADERNSEDRGRRRRQQRNGGPRGSGQMGLSGFSRTKPRNERVDRIQNKSNGNRNPMVVEIKKSNKDKAKGKAGSREEVDFRVKLEMCSKAGDVMGALSLYDSALKEGIKLGQYHYNVLLYLCSSAAIGVIHPAKSGSAGAVSSNTGVSGHGDSDKDSLSYEESDDNGLDSNFHLSGGRDSHSRNETREFDGDGRNDNGSRLLIHVSEDVRASARTRGFEIYEHMCLQKIPMSEAALTSIARIALSMGDGDMAFKIVKQMKELGITPRLRSYSPAIFAFCNNGDVDKAFEVERYMLESGVSPEEPELEALLKASVSARRGEKVYYLLHKLRTNVRQVSPSLADVIEAWFKSSTSSRVGKRKWDRDMVKQAMENGGGGWHGLGWLGKGKWAVVRTHVDDEGMCMGCGEKLVTIDLDPIETEKFATSVASIANKRERNSSFQKFQRWLDYYGPFEAVVDAANVGLFSQRQFSLSKVNAVVNAIRQKLPSKKWPLIIVHNRRLLGHKMDQPYNEKLKEKWKNADAIYATPTGSNDDWYWLYAAIKCKCLIVTNDEMRDHVFQILGNDFFPKWKERHQVHFSFRDGSFEFHMPPPCSVVIQESERGHWHFPILEEHGSVEERNWLCVTRTSSNVAMQDSSVPHEEAHREQMTRRSASDAQSIKVRRQQCRSSNKSIGALHKPSSSINLPMFRTIINDIEAAEKISGCIMDFQI